LVGELGDNTVADPRNFKNNVIASKQFADDPNSIMDSIIRLIDQTAEQVEKAARNNEGKDRISRRPPNTDDPIDDPRVISPRALSNAALPISLTPEGEQPAPPLQTEGTPEISSGKPVRILSRRIAGQSPASAFDTSAPAVLDRQDSFGDRFGNFTSSPDGTTPRNPNLAVPPSDPGRPLGIFSGKPMPLWTTPPPIWSLPDNSAASGNDDRNWFTTLGGLLWDGSKSRAPVIDAGPPASPMVSTDNPNFSGGLLGRLAAPAGIDPQDPNRSAPPPQQLDDEQEQADMRALDARLSSSGNIRDAVALYNAKKASRR
jgi:hypothetical protein